MTTPYVRYSDDIEVKQESEDERIDEIVASMSRVNQRVFDRHRHATRDAHAKSPRRDQANRRDSRSACSSLRS